MKNDAAHKARSTRLGDLLSSKMEEQGLSIKDLAEKIGMSYEHFRRIVKGQGIPSPLVLKALCELLGLNYMDAERMVTADRIRKKYGAIPLELSGKKPSLEPIERVWDLLTAEQQQDATTMIQAWAKRTKAAKSS